MHFFSSKQRMARARGRTTLSLYPPASLELKTIENTVGLLEVGNMDEREIKQTEMLCKVICKCNKNICNCVTLRSTLHGAVQHTDRERCRYEDNSVQETVSDDYYKPSGRVSDAPLY